jgi:hypothetical protein
MDPWGRPRASSLVVQTPKHLARQPTALVALYYAVVRVNPATAATAIQTPCVANGQSSRTCLSRSSSTSLNVSLLQSCCAGYTSAIPLNKHRNASRPVAAAAGSTIVQASATIKFGS